MIYVVSDVHGQQKALLSLLDRVGFNQRDYLYIIGDAIDTGADSISLLQWICRTPNVTFLQGNHEAMMIHSIHHNAASKEFKLRDSHHESTILWSNIAYQPPYPDLWLNKAKGKITAEKFFDLPYTEALEIWELLLSIKPWCWVTHTDETFLLSHAGIPTFEIDTERPEPLPIRPLHYSNRELTRILNRGLSYEANLWTEADYIFSGAFGSEATLISGHIASTNIPTDYPDEFTKLHEEQQRSVMDNHIYHITSQNSRKFIIDCGAAFDGNLGMLRLDDMAEFYIKI